MPPKGKRSRVKKRPPPSQEPKHVGGKIMFLPPKFTSKEIVHPYLRRRPDHPVAVISPTPDDDGIVEIRLIIIKFSNKMLDIAHTNKPLGKSQYTPLEPSEPHPENGTLLRLAYGCRKSILNNPVIDTGRVFHVAFPILRNYNRPCPQWRR